MSTLLTSVVYLGFSILDYGVGLLQVSGLVVSLHVVLQHHFHFTSNLICEVSYELIANKNFSFFWRVDLKNTRSPINGIGFDFKVGYAVHFDYGKPYTIGIIVYSSTHFAHSNTYTPHCIDAPLMTLDLTSRLVMQFILITGIMYYWDNILFHLFCTLKYIYTPLHRRVCISVWKMMWNLND